MDLPNEDKINSIIHELQTEKIDSNKLKNLQQEVNTISSANQEELVKELLLAQSLLYYHNHKDESAIKFAKAAIRKGADKDIVYNILRDLNCLYIEDYSPKKSPFHYIKVCYSKYASFGGRANRKEFWSFYLYYSIVGSLLNLIDIYTGWNIIASYGPLSLTFLLINIFPLISVSVRRLHDIGYPSTLYLINLLPIVGWFLFIIMMLTDSDIGSNKYGGNPKSGTNL